MAVVPGRLLGFLAESAEERPFPPLNHLVPGTLAAAGRGLGRAGRAKSSGAVVVAVK